MDLEVSDATRPVAVVLGPPPKERQEGIWVAETRLKRSHRRTATAREIADELHQLGLYIDEDTVRKWPKETARLLPPEST